MICFSIIAQNVQILTLGDLVYVRAELALLGISNFNPNVELAESRVSLNLETHTRAMVPHNTNPLNHSDARLLIQQSRFSSFVRNGL
jgi:hypothetical protein